MSLFSNINNTQDNNIFSNTSTQSMSNPSTKNDKEKQGK